MKQDALLSQLEHQFAELAHQLSPLAAHRSLSARFDKQLFLTKSTQIRDYLGEAQENLRRLRTVAQEGDAVQTAWIAERLVGQISALQREAATWPLRQYDSAHRGASALRNNLLKHQDYERRLVEMLLSREAQLANAAMLTEQQQLLREKTALEGRLARCRAALERLEDALDRVIR
ncbi:primosomal replication protein PriC [Mangrovibacter yixingensis]|uniref:primosomal replication protein PriC n=1 Tax=Mangrovibacter yixingensis TaxID=1529639 RepID=UPI001CF98D51|nr:primosomal replication protein PriC [Mangrovibacter yixingensis]